ncbi:MAG: PIN domain-containing protein [Stellaceae bacterium]
MDGYLFDTNTLSALLDPSHSKHADASAAVAALDSAAPKFVSVVALAELQFGKLLVEAFAGSTPARLTLIISRAQTYAPLEITRHTVAEYGELKANLAKLYLAKAFARDRPRWLENWVDQATGQRLQVDENDLWMCAQARERNLVMLTADRKMDRIARADPLVRLSFI